MLRRGHGNLVQFSKAYEQQADVVAVRMTSAAGFDAEGLLRYLNRESAGDARIAVLRATLQAPPPNSDDEFLQLQNQLRNSQQN